MLNNDSRRANQSVFVVGTDTEIGKTVVTALLALRLQTLGVAVGVMKPFASGCEFVNGRLQSDDARFLQTATGVADDLEIINPARWQEPLTPLVAARRAGDGSDYWSRAIDALGVLQSRHEVVVVEGVGGLLAPIAQRDGKILTNADWATALELPVVLVARRILGTINHTLLTLEVLRARHIPVAGLVFCDAVRVDESDVAAQTSAALIGEISGVEILGQVAHLPDLSRASLQNASQNLSAEFLAV